MSTPAEQFDSNSFEFDPTTGRLDRGSGLPRVADPGDEKLWVKFAPNSEYDDAASRDEGRPIFKMCEFIHIVVPGDPTCTVNRPVRRSDKERFSRQYAAFKTGREQAQGYPLSEWTQITRAQVEELGYFKISTVEQLAGMADNLLQRFPGLVTLRDRAKLYLEERKAAAPVDKLRAEVQKRDQRVNDLEKQLLQMQAKMDSLLTAAPPAGVPAAKK